MLIGGYDSDIVANSRLKRGAKRSAADGGAGGAGAVVPAAKRPRPSPPSKRNGWSAQERWWSSLARDMLDGQTMKPVGEVHDSSVPDVAAPPPDAAQIPARIARNPAAATGAAAGPGFVDAEATAIEAAAAAAESAESAAAVTAAASAMSALDGRLIGGLRHMLTNLEEDSKIASFLRTVCNVGTVALPEKSVRQLRNQFLNNGSICRGLLSAMPPCTRRMRCSP